MSTKTKPEMVTRVNSKPDTQAQIKALRAAGLDVIKDESGMYHCHTYQYGVDKDGKRTGKERQVKLFTAMPGRTGYLISRRADLFS